MQDKKILLVAFIIALLLGAFIGFQFGVALTIKQIAEIGKGFIDKELIYDALYRYKQRINDHYPPIQIENASIYNNTGK